MIVKKLRPNTNQILKLQDLCLFMHHCGGRTLMETEMEQSPKKPF